VPDRPRAPRAADPAGLHRQEPADLAAGERGGAAQRARRRGSRGHRGTRGGLRMGWNRKDLLTMRGLEASEIVLLVDTAASRQEMAGREIKKVPALRGKTVVNLFYESSTRTRTSFEIAGKWLSADVINFSASGSSTSKGESFVDTAKNIAAMSPDV